MSLSIASGWSPAGANGWCRRYGLSGNVTTMGEELACIDDSEKR